MDQRYPKIEKRNLHFLTTHTEYYFVSSTTVYTPYTSRKDEKLTTNMRPRKDQAGKADRKRGGR